MGITPEWSSADYDLDNPPSPTDLKGWADAVAAARKALVDADYEEWACQVLAQLGPPPEARGGAGTTPQQLTVKEEHMQDYRVDYVIVDGQNGRVGDGWCYLSVNVEPPSLDWVSNEVTRQLREQRILVGSDRARAVSYRPAASADR